MRLSAFTILILAAVLSASLNTPASARLMTRAEFMPICAKRIHGQTPAQVEMGCTCAYDQALMGTPLEEGVRDIIHEVYREPTQIAMVPEAKRNLVIELFNEVQQLVIDCMADAAENKLNPDGTKKK